MAGHGGKQLVAGARQHRAGIVLHQLGQHLPGQLHRIGSRQRRRNHPHRQRPAVECGDFQPELLQACCILLSRGNLLRSGRKHGWYQQGLGLQRCGLHLPLELFVDDALVRGMHVHDHHALRVFGHDVHAVDLRHGTPQGPIDRCLPIVNARRLAYASVCRGLRRSAPWGHTFPHLHNRRIGPARSARGWRQGHPLLLPDGCHGLRLRPTRKLHRLAGLHRLRGA